MQSIDNKFISFYYQTTKIPPISIDPKTTMLCIIDMQNEFVLRDYGEAEMFKKMGEWDRWIPMHDRLDNIVIPNTQKILEYFRSHNLYVSFARIACQLENGEDRSPVQKSEGWNGMLIPENSYGAQIIEPLKPIQNELIISKTTDSITTGTNYLQILRYMGIKTVIVTGIVTDQCVASSVRGLADEGLEVIVLEDCCAAGDIKLHEMELTIINIIYCRVMSCNEAIALLDNSIIK